MTVSVAYVRLSEFGAVKRFLDWVQGDLYPRLSVEAPEVKTELEDALARLFDEIVEERQAE